MICKKCENIIKENSKFCHHCGTKINVENKCRACNAILDEEDRFCSQCGTPASNSHITKQVIENNSNEIGMPINNFVSYSNNFSTNDNSYGADDEGIYCITGYNLYKLSYKVGGQIEVITNVEYNNGYYLNSINNYLYYIVPENDGWIGGIYRIRKDGEDKELIIKGNFDKLIIIQKKMYFTSGYSKEFRLYESELNGDRQRVICKPVLINGTRFMCEKIRGIGEDGALLQFCDEEYNNDKLLYLSFEKGTLSPYEKAFDLDIKEIYCKGLEKVIHEGTTKEEMYESVCQLLQYGDLTKGYLIFGNFMSNLCKYDIKTKEVTILKKPEVKPYLNWNYSNEFSLRVFQVYNNKNYSNIEYEGRGNYVLVVSDNSGNCRPVSMGGCNGIESVQLLGQWAFQSTNNGAFRYNLLTGIEERISFKELSLIRII